MKTQECGLRGLSQSLSYGGKAGAKQSGLKPRGPSGVHLAWLGWRGRGWRDLREVTGGC